MLHDTNKGFVLALIVTAILGFSLIHLVHDKVAHFTCFYLLTFLFYWLIDFGQSFTSLVGVSFIVCTVSGSIVLEFLQGIVNPARVYDTQDIIANMAGSCSGLISAIAFQLYKVSRRMETYQELPMSQI